MFQILGNLGQLLRSMLALGFAAFWGYLAYSWNEMGDLGPGQPTVIGVGILAIIAGFSGLVGLIRMVAKGASGAPPTHRDPVSITPEQRDADADAIIARYMARREQEGVGPIEPNPTESSPPNQPPQFGRKNR
jgi:hypothetical protein